MNFLNGVPISISLDTMLAAESIHPKKLQDKKRLLIISLAAILIARNDKKSRSLTKEGGGIPRKK
jgi:hypothetical protein